MAGRVTDWVSRVWNWKIIRTEEPSRVITPEEHLRITLGRFEPYVIKVQKVLIWENPFISALSILAINLIFWVFINFECRFYGFVFGALLIVFVYDMWMEKIWPEISVPKVVESTKSEDWTAMHPSLLSVQEISHYINMAHGMANQYYTWLKQLRCEQPGKFCCATCGLLVVMALVGRTISGAVFGYAVIMSLMIGPGLFLHVLPPSVMEKLKSYRSILLHRGKDTDSEEEDYLPEQTGENLELLHLAGEPEGSDKEEDDSSSHQLDLALPEPGAAGDGEAAAARTSSGLSAMPSPEGSTDGLSEFDISLTQNASWFKRQLDPEASESEDDDLACEIRFQSSHFNGDDSSSEDGGEKAFVQGLAFPEAAAEDRRPQQPESGYGAMLTSTVMQAVTGNFGSLGQSLLSTVMGTATATAATEEGDSSGGESEDFEMISQEDLS